MGAVWVAGHLTLGARVAVKFMSAELSMKHPELHARFLREAAAAAKITSPHVVRTFDFGAMADGTPFLVMELLEGESLADRLRRHGALPPSEVVLVVSQVAKALSEAHQLGVVHRDIKPPNVFLIQSGRELFAKVLDFGIAKDTDSAGGNATKTGFALGTPQYMSPEQLMSAKGVDLQADLWALAVMAYELLTGAPPFVGETIPHLILSIHTRQFQVPSSARHPPLVTDASALDRFFARAFAADMAARFSSAQDLADALADACGAHAEAPASRVSRPSLVGRSSPAPSLAAVVPSRILLPRRGPSRVKIAAAVIGMIGVVFAVALVVTRAVVGRHHDEAAEPKPPAPSEVEDMEETVEVDAAAAAPEPSASERPRSTPRTDAIVAVPEGPAGADGDAWIPAFTARATATPLRSLAAAFTACRDRGKALCTESQWVAACGLEPALGASRAWTATAEGNRAVVRGGGGCGDRAPVPSGASGIGAVCCDPAVAVVVDGEELKRLTSARLTDYQLAMNASRADKLAREFYGENVNFLNKERSRDELQRLAQSYFKKNPDQGQIYDRCRITLAGGQWVAVCSTILFHGGETFGLEQKLTFNRGPNRLLAVGEDDVNRVP